MLRFILHNIDRILILYVLIFTDTGAHMIMWTLSMIYNLLQGPI